MNFKKIMLSFLSMIGLIAPVNAYANEINNIDINEPIVLQHSQEFQQSRDSFINGITSNNKDVELVHYSHSSHGSHGSHGSHRSHYSSGY